MPAQAIYGRAASSAPATIRPDDARALIVTTILLNLMLLVVVTTVLGAALITHRLAIRAQLLRRHLAVATRIHGAEVLGQTRRARLRFFTADAAVAIPVDSFKPLLRALLHPLPALLRIVATLLAQLLPVLGAGLVIVAVRSQRTAGDARQSRSE